MEVVSWLGVDDEGDAAVLVKVPTAVIIVVVAIVVAAAAGVKV